MVLIAKWMGASDDIILSLAPKSVTAPVAMGVAVCAMHYTGMAAADFICTSPGSERFATPQGFGVISSMDLAVLTPVVAIAMALLIAFDQVIQKNLAPQPQRA